VLRGMKETGTTVSLLGLVSGGFQGIPLAKKEGEEKALSPWKGGLDEAVREEMGKIRT